MWKQHSRRSSRHHTSTAGSSLSPGSEASLDSVMSSSCILNSTGHRARCRSANICTEHLVCLLFLFYIKLDLGVIKMKLSAWTVVLFVLFFQQTVWSFGITPSCPSNECGAGMRCTTSGSCESCTACEDGKFRSQCHSLSSCEDCPGNFSTTLNGTDCVCLPGAQKFRLVNNTINWELGECEQCLAGSFQETYTNGICTLCSAGTYVGTVGASTCLDCPVGTFNSSSGATTCGACALGTVPTTARDACDACPVGKFGETNASICTACPDGFFSDTNASTSCGRCTPGSIPSAQRDACDACPTGKFGQPEASNCMPCTDGFFSDTNASTSCGRCAPGSIPSTQRDACDACPPGTFGESNASTCTTCPLGTYAPGANSTACLTCPPGMVSLASRDGP
mgnify:CR=1 FL=1